MVSIFFSSVALFLSFAVAIIAALQWRVADNKLRLDLFDRRYKVYDATRKFLAAITSKADFTMPQLGEFNVGTSDAEFLFEADVVNYLQQIRERAVNMHTARTLFETQPNGDERSRNVQRHYDDLSWLNEQITEMTKTFAPYLGFANVRLRFWPSLKLFSANR